MTFFTLFKRKPVFPLFLALLLILATSLTAIGATMLFGTFRQDTQVSDEYVTIAVFPDYKAPTAAEIASGSYTRRNYDPFGAHQAAMNSGFVQAVDYRYMLGAEVKGSRAIASGFLDPLNYDVDFDMPCYNMAVFAVKCTYVRNGETSTPLGEIIAGYDVTAEIIDVVSLADGYPDIYDDTDLLDIVPGEGLTYGQASVPVPATIHMQGTLFTPDGKIPFQVGKTYLIYGYYSDYKVQTNYSNSGLITGRMVSTGRDFYFIDYKAIYTNSGGFTENDEMSEVFDAAMRVKRGFKGDGTAYWYPSEEMLPRWIEYNGAWEDCLASEEGTVWREEILPLCKINQSSATVILSDNVQSMYVFNTGAGGLQDGRFFDVSDYDKGNKVCMISAAYAQWNGYKIGDRLTLDFYDTGSYNDETILRGPCLPEKKMHVTEEYEIIGIYTAPEFSRGVQLFCADTILIPKKSVPGSEAFPKRIPVALLTSLILNNGTKDSFLSYMEEAGQKDAFLCFDQNFSAAEISLDTLIQNGQRLLLIGLSILVVAAALAHFLTVRRFAPTAKTMRLLGYERRIVCRQAWSAFLAIDAVSAAFGVSLAAALFSRITEKTLSEALAPDPIVMVGCAAAVFVFLGLLSLLCAKLLSNLPLMQSAKKRGSLR